MTKSSRCLQILTVACFCNHNHNRNYNIRNSYQFFILFWNILKTRRQWTIHSLRWRGGSHILASIHRYRHHWWSLSGLLGHSVYRWAAVFWEWRGDRRNATLLHTNSCYFCVLLSEKSEKQTNHEYSKNDGAFCMYCHCIYIYIYIYIDNNYISKAMVYIQVTTSLDSLIFSFQRGLEMIWRCRPGLMMIDCHPWNPWHGYFHCERHEIHHLWIPGGQRWWIWFREWFQNLSKNFSWALKHSNEFRIDDASFGKWTNKTH